MARLAGGLEHLPESVQASRNIGTIAPGGVQICGLHDAHPSSWAVSGRCGITARAQLDLLKFLSKPLGLD